MMRTVNSEEIEWKDNDSGAYLFMYGKCGRKVVGKVRTAGNGFSGLICCDYAPAIEFQPDFDQEKELGLYKTIQEAKLEVEISFAKMIDNFNRFRFVRFIWSVVTLRAFRGTDPFEVIEFVWNIACTIAILYMIDYFFKTHPFFQHRF